MTHSRQLLLGLVATVFSTVLLAQTSTLTYQGQLRASGQPFTGLLDLEFRLFDQLSGGGGEQLAEQTRGENPTDWFPVISDWSFTEGFEPGDESRWTGGSSS